MKLVSLKFFTFSLIVLLSKHSFGQFFPGKDDLFQGLLRESRAALTEMKGNFQGRDLNDSCELYQSINTQNGDLLKEYLLCSYQNEKSERVALSKDGLVLFEVQFVFNSTPSKRVTLAELRSLVFSSGEGSFYANNLFSLRAHESREGESVLLQSEVFNYRLVILEGIVRGHRRLSYERQCSWCFSPAKVEVVFAPLGTQYYSDQAPGREVTPRLFQQALARIYYETVGWLSQQLSAPLDDINRFDH